MNYLDDVKKLKKITSKFSEGLDKAEKLLSEGNITETTREFLSLETLSEEITNKTRLLPSAFFNFKEEDSEILKENILESLDIVVSYILDGRGFYLKIPRLLPKKNGGNPIYIRTSVALALDDFFDVNAKLKIEEPSTIIFKHNYDINRPENKYRDHDNIELNVVVDLLAMHLLKDDSPLLLRHYYLSTPSSFDNTEVFIVPNDEFVNFIKDF